MVQIYEFELFQMELYNDEMYSRDSADNYKIPNGYVIHGEQSITRVNQNGKIDWSMLSIVLNLKQIFSNV